MDITILQHAKDNSPGRLSLDEVAALIRGEGRPETYQPLMNRLAELGVTPETTYLYMRGHDLLEKIVAPLLENVCNILRRRRQKEIKNLAVHSTQRQNELAGYQHSAASPTEMLRKHTDYRRCPLYKQIQSNIVEQCLG